MNLENFEFVLLGLCILKERNGQSKTSYRELQRYLNQDPPQVSQALIKNEEKGYIEKEKDHKRFDVIIITEQGTQYAKLLTQKFGKFFSKSYTHKTPEYLDTDHMKQPPPKKLTLKIVLPMQINFLGIRLQKIL